jgi:hypothetical protein
MNLDFSNKLSLLFLVWICSTVFPETSSSQVNGYCCIDKKFRLFVAQTNEVQIKNLDSDIVMLSSNMPISQEELLESGEILRILNANHIIFKKTSEINLPEIKSTPVNNLWKLNSSVLEWLQNQTGPSTKKLQLIFDREAELPAALEKSALKVLAKNHLVEVELSAAGLKNILEAYPSLRSVTPAGSSARAESLLQDNDLTVNEINFVHSSRPNLRGASQNISIKEGAFDPQDLDIRNRVIEAYQPDETIDAHATQMATYIAGAGNTAPQSQGVAEEALVSTTTFDDLFASSYIEYLGPLNIKLQNHSYGVPDPSNYYGPEALSYDEQVYYNDQELVHVFSVGNPNKVAPTDGVYANVNGFALLTGNFKQAKNILTIGSVDSVLRVDRFNASGPAFDGRIKPDLVAYSVGGSSNSAALASGAVALLQNTYLNKTGSYPNVALVRSVLMASAQDVGRPGPDYDAGWGNIQLEKALQIIENNQYTAKTLTLTNPQNTTITIPANATNLRVAISWVDPPSNVNDNITLLQDLDILVKAPNGETFLPWVLSIEADSSRLSQAATRGKDHINVAELVSLEDVPAGNYQIQVTSNALPFGDQPYYLSWQWDVAENFTWTYPTGLDNAPVYGERPPFLRWDSSYPSGTQGKLEYNLDGGEWVVIGESVDLRKTFHFWNVPETHAIGQLRMTVGGKTYLSDRFTVGRFLRPTVGFSCADSLLIQWSEIAAADRYKIYTLGEKYLELFTTTTDTFKVFKQEELGEGYYAVAPVLSGKEAAKSLLYNWENQALACYINNFDASRYPNDPLLADLRLTVGTLYQVERIVFERQEVDGSYSVIATIDNPISLSTTLSEVELVNGNNIFRAKLELNNGQTVVSDLVESEVLTDIQIYPNPINVQDDYLYLAYRGFKDKGYVEIFNMQGASQFFQVLNAENYSTDLEISELKPGMYVVRVFMDGTLSQKKLVVY